ncbi:hypothetical protein PV04_06394 [Phialophora macrospora]|uniref:Uncharacterized protein n=1 Tax=Phialophora macrospora TaxID=1851006 RepID=A0A0D2CPN3_9EURO|nr:hypothetical protein PV04_06394 [Phialophora macrospora]
MSLFERVAHGFYVHRHDTAAPIGHDPRRAAVHAPSNSYLASLTDQQLRHRVSETKTRLATETAHHKHLQQHLHDQLRRAQRTRDALRAQEKVVERAKGIKDAYMVEKASRDDENARRRNERAGARMGGERRGMRW